MSAARPGVREIAVRRSLAVDVGHLNSRAHAVQFYEDDLFLLATVRRFVLVGIEAGDAIVVVCTREHHPAFARILAPHLAEPGGGCLLLDAGETLSRFMVEGMPDGDRFRDVLEGIIADVSGASRTGRLRIFGEMVSLLWQNGNSRAAIRLEELWCEASRTREFSLLCGYVMGNFYREEHTKDFVEICDRHSLVLPTEQFAGIDEGGARLREIARLEQRARSLENELPHRRYLEAELRDALEQRRRAEEELRLCLERERVNTDRAAARDAGQERRIRLLRDLTGAGIGDGKLLQRGDAFDLRPLVSQVVDETRVAYPGRDIVTTTEPALAWIDSTRFQQLVKTLLVHALIHGDPIQPVRVTLAVRDRVVCLDVHRHGPPLEPSVLRGDHLPEDEESLALLVAEQIVLGHRGRMSVESTVTTGTTFAVTLPHG